MIHLKNKVSDFKNLLRQIYYTRIKIEIYDI